MRWSFLFLKNISIFANVLHDMRLAICTVLLNIISF